MMFRWKSAPKHRLCLPKDEELRHGLKSVGFDQKSIFIADSLAELANCEGKGYNRKVPWKDFRKLWNTSMLKMPLYRNTFFAVSAPDAAF